MDPSLNVLAKSAWDASTYIMEGMESARCKLQQFPTDNAQERTSKIKFLDLISQTIHDIEICRHVRANYVNQDNIYLYLPEIQETLLYYFRLLDVVEDMVALRARLHVLETAVAPRMKELPIRPSS